MPDEETGKKSNEKVYATLLRGKQADSRNEMMSFLWAEEGNYSTIVAIPSTITAMPELPQETAAKKALLRSK